MLDYEVSGNLLKNYSNMRIIALGVSLTTIGSLFSLNINDFTTEFILQSVIIISTYLSIRIIGSINANVYARCLHMEWLEEKMSVIGFFKYWNKYVLEKSKNASSNAFYVSCHVINLLGLIIPLAFIYRSVFAKSKSYNTLNSVTALISLDSFLILICVFFFVRNLLYINRNLVTKTLIPRIRAELNDIRKSLKNYSKS